MTHITDNGASVDILISGIIFYVQEEIISFD